MRKRYSHPNLLNCRIQKPGGNPSTKSFVIYMDGDEEKTLYFTPEDTPLSNFCVAWEDYKVAGQTVPEGSIIHATIGTDYSDVTTIGNNFLYGNQLTSVDFSAFTNVTSIGNNFLGLCSSLTSVDLSAFTSVTSIGNHFLGGCKSLTSLDLSAFTSVTSLGDYFLGGCSSLTSVDLSPLSNVTSIGDSFLSSCSSLTSVDLSPLSNVTSIGDSFLDYCRYITQFTMGATTPPTIGRFGDGLQALTCILVPDGSVDDYQTAPTWSSKVEFIRGFSVGCVSPQ